MNEACTFFDSDGWDARIEAHVGRVWDLETALRKVEAGDPQRRIEEIASALESEPGALAVTSLAEVLSMDGSSSLAVSLTDAARVWRDERDGLPEACPHEPVAGTDRCPFHLSPNRYEEVDLTPKEVDEALAVALDTQNGQEKCFVGSRLRNLDLSDRRIGTDDNANLDLRFATVEGEVDCRNTHFAPPVTMEGTLLSPDGSGKTGGSATAANRYVSVDGDIDFRGASFESSADFKHVRFGSAVTFNGADFGDVAMFNYATFDDRVEIWASFERKADFSKATVRGPVQLRGTYNHAAIFNYTIFESDVTLWNTTFGHKAEFLATTIQGAFDCEHATFRGVVRFSETEFGDAVNFASATFEDLVRFRRIRAPNAVVDLGGAKLSGGCIELDGETHYDLRDATVGDVSVEATDESLSADPFGYLRILRTDFEGFDFGAHASAFKPDWQIDDLSESWPDDSRDPAVDALERYEELEDTYLRAKSGATESGHNKAASEFFIHEMRYRRKQHGTLFLRRLRTVLRDDPSSAHEYVLAPFVGVFRALVDIGRRVVPWSRPKHRKRDETPAWQAIHRWLSNATLNLIAGYGERPKRPLTASAVTILVFAVGYWVLRVPPTSETPFGLGYVLLSIQSFITFILGSSPVKSDFLPQLLSAVEGFAGAFFTAIFVFTLTRSIHR